MKKAIKEAAISLFLLVVPDPEGHEPTTKQLIGFYSAVAVGLAVVVAWNA